MITLDGWTGIMYNLQKWNTQPLVPGLLCMFLVILGAFFLRNLMLAVIMEKYLETEEFEKKRLE